MLLSCTGPLLIIWLFGTQHLVLCASCLLPKKGKSDVRPGAIASFMMLSKAYSFTQTCIRRNPLRGYERSK